MYFQQAVLYPIEQAPPAYITVNRYWVKTAGGNWNDTDGWSYTSGGTAEATEPIITSNVFFDGNSGSNTVTITANEECHDLDLTNYTGVLNLDNKNIDFYGNLTLDSTMDLGGGQFTAKGGEAQAFNDGGRGEDNYGIVVNKDVGTTLTMNSQMIGTRGSSLEQGIWDFNDFNVSSQSFQIVGTNTRVLNMGNGTVEPSNSAGTVWTVSGSGYTINPEGSTLLIDFNGATDVTFAGGGATYNNFTIQHGAAGGGVVISGSNTFNVLTIDITNADQIIKFTDGTTQTVSSLVATGTSAKPITLQGTGSGTWNIVDTSGTNSVEWCLISGSAASGGATFNSFLSNGCRDMGGNSGWNFGGAVSEWAMDMGALYPSAHRIDPREHYATVLQATSGGFRTELDLTLSYVLSADTGVYTVTGSTAGLEWDRILEAIAGVYSVTGSTANLEWDHILVAATGVYTITGSTAGLEHDRILASDTGSYSITGSAANLEWDRILAANTGGYTLTGSTADLLQGYKVNADTGAYAVTGSVANLEWDHILAAVAGVYTITGSAAQLNVGVTLVADTGVYTVTGSAAALEWDRILGANTGVYAITGSTAGLEWDRILAANTGVYTVTGSSAGLEHGYVLNSDTGAYSITGSAAALEWDRILAAASGAYNVTGSAATLTIAGGGITMLAETGSYAITGSAAELKHGYVLSAASGVYTLTGSATTLTVGAAGGDYKNNRHILVVMSG